MRCTDCGGYRRNMSMGMGFGLHQSLSLSQHITLGQHLVLTMSMILNLTDGSPDRYYRKLVDFIVERIRNESLRAAVHQLLHNDHLVDTIFLEEIIQKLGSPTPRIFQEISLYAIHGMHKDESSSDKSSFKVAAIDLHKAFFTPEEVKRDIALLQNLGQAPEVRADPEIIKYQNSLRMADAAESLVDNFSMLLSLAFQIADSKGESYLRSFFRDKLIFDKLQSVVADRTMNRFASRFITIPKKSRPKEHQLAFINTVFEYLLAAAGVISPRIFLLHKAKDEVDIEVLSNTMEEINQIYLNYGLSRQETFYWNRWAVIGQKPSRITDNMIRDLMRAFQVEEGAGILEIANFDDAFEQIMDIRRSMSSKPDRDELNETQAHLHGIIVHVLTQRGLNEYLAKILQDRWYQRFVDLGFSPKSL